MALISIHAPREGSDYRFLGFFRLCNGHFYPRSPRGERLFHWQAPLPVRDFYPRSPRGERPRRPAPPTSSSDFYPRSPRGERRGRDRIPGKLALISIHAPREGSDRRPSGYGLALTDFYPRSPRGERLDADLLKHGGREFYPRSPRGERPQGALVGPGEVEISIHAPREGSDGDNRDVFDLQVISIHAPREGSDRVSWPAAAAWSNFYPRSPRGERRTVLVRGGGRREISIHAPREGSDKTWGLPVSV